MYVIGNTTNSDLYWCNEHGWSCLDEADIFTRDEQAELRLPLDGYWCTLWAVDGLQFARFIAECEAAGVLTGDSLDDVGDSMDLSRAQLDQIIERAQNYWDNWVDRVRAHGKPDV